MSWVASDDQHYRASWHLERTADKRFIRRERPRLAECFLIEFPEQSRRRPRLGIAKPNFTDFGRRTGPTN